VGSVPGCHGIGQSPWRPAGPGARRRAKGPSALREPPGDQVGQGGGCCRPTPNEEGRKGSAASSRRAKSRRWPPPLSRLGERNTSRTIALQDASTREHGGVPPRLTAARSGHGGYGRRWTAPGLRGAPRAGRVGDPEPTQFTSMDTGHVGRGAGGPIKGGRRGGRHQGVAKRSEAKDFPRRDGQTQRLPWGPWGESQEVMSSGAAPPDGCAIHMGGRGVAVQGHCWKSGSEVQSPGQ